MNKIKDLLDELMKYCFDINQRHGISLLIITTSFFTCVLQNIHLPGLYQDAVNPDYLAAKYLSGNDLGSLSHFPPYDGFPTLGQLYHGVTSFYFGILFFKIFGMNIVSLRIMHGFFGLCILLAIYILLFLITRNRLLACFVAILLAFDPAFIFSFRTQCYITLAPTMWLFTAFILLLNLFHYQKKPNIILFFAGFFLGLSFYGYFIYFFYFPAFFIVTYFFVKKLALNFKTSYFFLIIGILFGSLLYFYGYIRAIIAWGGLKEILSNFSSLNVYGQSLSFWQKLSLLYAYTYGALTSGFQYFIIFGIEIPVNNGIIKFYIFLTIILIGYLISFFKKSANFYVLNIIFLFYCSFYTIGFIFSSRLSYHHMIALLPLFYLAFGFAIEQIYKSLFEVETFYWLKSSAIGALVSILIFCLVINVNLKETIQKNLVSFGGVTTYSDSTYLLAEEALREPRKTYYIFDDWGFFMPFNFLTAGQIPFKIHFNNDDLKLIPCDNDLVFTFWGDKNDRIQHFVESIGEVIDKRLYYQRNKKLSFTALRVSNRKFCS